MVIPFSKRNPKYWHGDIVYLVTCDTPERGMVTGVDFRPTHELFEVTWGRGGVTYHYGMELSTEFVPEFSQEKTAN